LKFIVDANLPRRLSRWFNERGYDSIHTLDLIDKNLTEDDFISNLSIKENRIVITKDKDFFNSFILKKVPYKLILIISGNLQNDSLIKLFEDNLEKLLIHLENNSLIELDINKFTVIS
jgi:predicted nuclease of predicted toxin-antitoxin system